jgi:hypothetical protein
MSATNSNLDLLPPDIWSLLSDIPIHSTTISTNILTCFFLLRYFIASLLRCFLYFLYFLPFLYILPHAAANLIFFTRPALTYPFA